MVSLGEELKRERELREISLREISEATKISVRILEAIEHDNYKILPGGVFNRNFLRAYAEFIGLDPENVVRKYQQQYSEEPESPVLTFPPQPKKQKEEPFSKKTLFLFSAILLMLVLLLVFLFSLKKKHRTSPGEPIRLEMKV